MPVNKFTKTVTLKDGTVKVYEYFRDSSEYSKTAYNNKKEKKPKVECEKCHRMVYEFYLDKHKTKKICRPDFGKNIKVINPDVQN